MGRKKVNSSLLAGKMLYFFQEDRKQSLATEGGGGEEDFPLGEGLADSAVCFPAWQDLRVESLEKTC